MSAATSAPTLLRSQLLSAVYQAVRRGDLEKQEADRQLDHAAWFATAAGGDRVLQGTARQIADELGWADTYDAARPPIRRRVKGLRGNWAPESNRNPSLGEKMGRSLGEKMGRSLGE